MLNVVYAKKNYSVNSNTHERRYFAEWTGYCSQTHSFSPRRSTEKTPRRQLRGREHANDGRPLAGNTGTAESNPILLDTIPVIHSQARHTNRINFSDKADAMESHPCQQIYIALLV